MNDRIKKLAEQATTYSWLNGQGTSVDFDLEKFTELLLNESIDVMIKHDYHGEWLGQKLKQHFGVK